MVDEGQQYYFIATMVASIVGFVLAFVINRFVNKLDERMNKFDQRMEKQDKMFDAIQEEISELKQISVRHDVEIDHIKGKPKR
jgi:uncharacterized membrane-anchored protein YhcB (DUF1043 family)